MLKPLGDSALLIQLSDQVARRSGGECAEIGQGRDLFLGEKIVRVDTLCLRGDNPRAAENARLLRGILTINGIEVVGLK